MARYTERFVIHVRRCPGEKFEYGIDVVFEGTWTGCERMMTRLRKAIRPEYPRVKVSCHILRTAEWLAELTENENRHALTESQVPCSTEDSRICWGGR